MATYPTRTKRWTRAEYDRLIDLGVFQTEDRIELIGGELMVAEPAHHCERQRFSAIVEPRPRQGGCR